MEKQKRWHFFVIIAAIALTLYNILPTIFYYSKPLKEAVGKQMANEVASQIAQRVDHLQAENKEWIEAFAKNLGTPLQSLAVLPENPRYFLATFQEAKDARAFSQHLPRAGALIPFVPAQLQLAQSPLYTSPKQVLIQRNTGFSFPPESGMSYFQFSEKFAHGQATEAFRNWIYHRTTPIALHLGGESDEFRLMRTVDASRDAQSDSLALALAQEILEMENLFGDTHPIARRYFARYTQSALSENERNEYVETFIQRLQQTAKKLEQAHNSLQQEIAKQKTETAFVETAKMQQLQQLETGRIQCDAAALVVKRNQAVFASGSLPLTIQEIQQSLQSFPSISRNSLQVIDLQGRHPFIQNILLDWNKNELSLVVYQDVQASRFQERPTEWQTRVAEKLNRLLSDDIALLSRLTDEKIVAQQENFSIEFDRLSGSNSFLSLDLAKVADQQLHVLQNWLRAQWQPKHIDLLPSSFPMYASSEWEKLPSASQKFGLVFYAPSLENAAPSKGFRTSSLYVIAKGISRMVQHVEKYPDSPEAKQFLQDFEALKSLMQQEGFFAYPAYAYSFSDEYAYDYIFERDHFFSDLVKATREAFTVLGNHRQAVLEFSNVEQRILTQNRIEDAIHESLLKWRDDYHAAQVNLRLEARYDVPPPNKNVYWQNFLLSTAKYFRGDDRKILKWGLDLSGGKTVRIGLLDQNRMPVTDPTDLRQGVNELYKRVNKMGVSEVGIRIENSHIVLDFPGSQGLSASELVKSASMTFHVVNEQFTPRNTDLAGAVNSYLQEVWNEAVITNRRDIESINAIAFRHLGGDAKEGALRAFSSSAAQTLYESGLRIADPAMHAASSALDDALSMVAIFRGDDFSEWEGQTHPLLIVFQNYALAGSSLENIQAGYDPSKGNILSFEVRGSYMGKDGSRLQPRDDFYNWTAQFSQDKIAGTSKEAFSGAEGWRMAVILNGQIVNAPTLSEPLRDRAMISGRFSQHEVNQLAADLKAGSLTFTPKILSEQNVSPELGIEERRSGIMAAALATLLVAFAMIAYYRFAGLVASVAVFFNLLIMWAALQNLGAAITLPGIAGIILTLGMAVDANVLVYERIREEFEISKRLPSAIQAGYRKAFSAIIDSNLTTIIAALILLQFDSGPIKGFAISLIIGIVSSMFTALFMTRFFFASWVQNPGRKELKMARLFTKPSFDFLKYTKAAFILSAVVIAIGGVLLFSQRHTLFGMDFTGGYALTVHLQEKDQADLRKEVVQALHAEGAPLMDIQVRELNRPNSLRIQLGMGMQQPGNPFYDMPAQIIPSNETVYSYQQNPRIDWVVNALAKHDLIIQSSDLDHLDKNWSEMSGQLSDAMRNNALWGVMLALACILFYLTFRFEFKYAISAILGLVHDVLITLGLLALLHICGVQLQIDLQVIGAIMTIIGYSLNDTIIVFDRIREDTRLNRKAKFSFIVNMALNTTLSRTVMTSGTTLLVLLALVCFGGPSIFGFALVMTLGVIVGTLSSLFVASPMLLYFHHREVKQTPRVGVHQG